MRWTLSLVEKVARRIRSRSWSHRLQWYFPCDRGAARRRAWTARHQRARLARVARVKTTTQLQDRPGVDLADPALGDAEHLADLGQGQAFVVVKGEDDLLASPRRLMAPARICFISSTSKAAIGPAERSARVSPRVMVSPRSARPPDTTSSRATIPV